MNFKFHLLVPRAEHPQKQQQQKVIHHNWIKIFATCNIFSILILRFSKHHNKFKTNTHIFNYFHSGLSVKTTDHHKYSFTETVIVYVIDTNKSPYVKIIYNNINIFIKTGHIVGGVVKGKEEGGRGNDKITNKHDFTTRMFRTFVTIIQKCRQMY